MYIQSLNLKFSPFHRIKNISQMQKNIFFKKNLGKIIFFKNAKCLKDMQYH